MLAGLLHSFYFNFVFDFTLHYWLIASNVVVAAVVWVLGDQQVKEAALLCPDDLVDIVGVRVNYR